MATEHSKPTEFPRWVHKAQVADKHVANVVEYDKAVGEGWSADPVAVTVYKDDETAIVYTLEALTAAREQGWRTTAPAGSHGAHTYAPEDEKAKPKK